MSGRKGKGVGKPHPKQSQRPRVVAVYEGGKRRRPKPGEEFGKAGTLHYITRSGVARRRVPVPAVYAIDLQPREEVSCEVGPMITVYIDYLLAEGMNGDTREEVIRSMLCRGIMESIPGPTIRQLVEREDKRRGKGR